MNKKKRFAKVRALNRKRNFFIKKLRLYIARIFFDYNKPRPFDLSECKTVLFLRDDDKIGDMVVSTCLYRDFYHSGYQVDVLAGKKNASVLEYNPYIKNLHISGESKCEKMKVAKKLRLRNYDLLIDMGDKLSPFSLKFLRAINAKNVIGFNKAAFNIYNHSITFTGFDKHITERYKFLMEDMGLENYSAAYDLHLSDAVINDVENFIENLSYDKMIVINPFTADSRRDMSLPQLNQLIEELKRNIPNCAIIIIGDPSVIKKIKNDHAIISPFTSLSSSCRFIYLADLIITPDTSIVHIAAAWHKPLVSLYGHDMHGDYINSILWGPGYPEATQIFTHDKYHSISSISVNQIIKAVMEKL